MKILQEGVAWVTDLLCKELCVILKRRNVWASRRIRRRNGLGAPNKHLRSWN